MEIEEFLEEALQSKHIGSTTFNRASKIIKKIQGNKNLNRIEFYKTDTPFKGLLFHVYITNYQVSIEYSTHELKLFIYDVNLNVERLRATLNEIEVDVIPEIIERVCK